MQSEWLAVDGIRLGVASAGIKTPGRLDLVVFELSDNTVTAAVFTKNAFCAAPVTVARQHLQAAAPKYFIINTGNANAGTGAQGVDDALACCAALAERVGVSKAEVLPFSTGVIGEPLPTAKIISALDTAVAGRAAQAWESAATGILTTDTVPKGCSRTLRLQGQQVTITGIAKGSGMIHPNMATLLAFITTDLAVDQALLHRCLQQAVETSFNRISVDGDMSTNDACTLSATGKSGVILAASNVSEVEQFQSALTDVAETLAQALVRDGEGATKFVTIEVSGGRTPDESLRVAKSVANSPLVKTALFASDANWGRILAAIGYAGVENIDMQAIQIKLGDICIVRDGGRAPDYQEELGQQEMNKQDIVIAIDLARGNSFERVWTCDFSYDYVRINAEYRT
ncbi:MAG: bifunctional glutamate N-acetyltransferase/amino-acid acetyltransferase ArgJ [Gammaproteobacteria bacterium]|nr:bifunctional glutamate N-acetyltransferase/amino-acid acetyltransferase ArgJ [Gammaproteobacteria bacterium]